MSLTRPADAIIFPEGMFKGSRTRDASPLHAIDRVIGPWLGTRKVHSNRNPLGFCFATATPGHVGKGLRFAASHPRAGQEAYLWYRAIRRGDDVTLGDEVTGFQDHDGGILIGYRKPDAEPATVTAAQAAAEQASIAAATSPEAQRSRIERWRAEGILTDAERDQAMELLKQVARESSEAEKPLVDEVIRRRDAEREIAAIKPAK